MEVTVIIDKEAQLDSSKQKEDDGGRQRLSSINNDRKHVKARKKKPRSALSNHAEEFQKELKISKEEHQKRLCDRLCLCCVRKGHYVGDCKINTPSSLGKGRQS